jgi:acetyl esterase
MPLDPQMKVILDQMAAAGVPPLHKMSPLEARQAVLAMRATQGEPERVGKVEDRSIPGPGGPIALRIYTPEGSGPFPVLVYFHGGGWVVGSIETVDASCRSLTNGANCMVVSSDYRLAPEHKFPAAADDCYAATRWVAENAVAIGGDPTRIAVGGESAGSNLAAVVALMARDRGTPPLAYQLLIYPVTDYAFDTVSYRENAEDYFLTKDMMAWFWNLYLHSQADGHNPYASPLQAQDLRGLAPALVITAEFDPLRDEGEAYAARLREAGVPAISSRYSGVIHGFFGMAAALDQAKRAIEEAAAGLRSAFAR